MVVASLCTIKVREDALKQVIDSIINQVDCLIITYQDYEEIPEKPHKKVIQIRGKNYLGSSDRFWPLKNLKGYHFTLDDDIIYPPDYVKVMKAKVDEYKTFVCVHGSNFRTPFKSYHKSRVTHNFRFPLPKDMKVHVPGAGTMAYNSDHVRFDMSFVKHRNITDLYIGIYCRINNIPIYCVERPAGWLTPIPTIGPDIHSAMAKDHRVHDSLVKEYFLNKREWPQPIMTIS